MNDINKDDPEYRAKRRQYYLNRRNRRAAGPAYADKAFSRAEELMGRTAGPKTRHKMEDILDELYRKGLTSKDNGDVLAHFWRAHSRVMRRVRELEQETQRLRERRPSAPPTRRPPPVVERRYIRRPENERTPADYEEEDQGDFDEDSPQNERRR